MQYFFPDSQDLVDPSFDFKKETRGITRLRQRDDCYPHEIFKRPPYDGVLISRAIVDERYTLAQKQRLLRLGAREFLRIGESRLSHLKVMGDFGAFSYKAAEVPPFTVDDVIDFYERCGFDLGISVDHVILAFDTAFDRTGAPEMLQNRQKLTLEYATEFFRKTDHRRVGFKAMGVAQGWSPKSYARAVVALQKMGYTYIAMGGMVPMKSQDILATLAAVKVVLKPMTRLHLLGVTRCENFADFQNFGVISFDSTSVFVQAFKADSDNYHTDAEPFIALRVPQVEGNPKLKAAILSGRVHQETARQLEKDCLHLLSEFDRGEVAMNVVLDKLVEYEELYAGKSTHRDSYRRVLEAKPWQKCECEVCSALSVHVMLFRGAERNRRRGFHNLQIFYRKIRQLTLEHRNQFAEST
jgi:hypothetical protein